MADGIVEGFHGGLEWARDAGACGEGVAAAAEAGADFTDIEARVIGAGADSNFFVGEFLVEDCAEDALDFAEAVHDSIEVIGFESEGANFIK